MKDVSRSTSHMSFTRWQSPLLLAALALRLGLKVEAAPMLDLKVVSR